MVIQNGKAGDNQIDTNEGCGGDCQKGILRHILRNRPIVCQQPAKNISERQKTAAKEAAQQSQQKGKRKHTVRLGVLPFPQQDACRDAPA